MLPRAHVGPRSHCLRTCTRHLTPAQSYQRLRSPAAVELISGILVANICSVHARTLMHTALAGAAFVRVHSSKTSVQL